MLRRKLRYLHLDGSLQFRPRGHPLGQMHFVAKTRQKMTASCWARRTLFERQRENREPSPSTADNLPTDLHAIEAGLENADASEVAYYRRRISGMLFGDEGAIDRWKARAVLSKRARNLPS